MISDDFDKRPSTSRSHRNLVEDFEKRRFAQLMLVVIIGVAITLSITLLQGDFINFGVGSCAILSFYFLRELGLKRNIKAAIVICISISICLISIMALRNNGINDSTIFAFFVPISFAAILGNNKVFSFTVAAIFAAIGFIYISGEYGLFESHIKNNALHKTLAVLGFIGIISGVMWRISRDVKSALNVSANELMRGGSDSVFGYNRSISDPLTKLLNLYGMEEKYREASRIATMRENKMSLMRIYFSSINKSLFLQDVIFREKFTIETAKILKKLFRGTDLIANIGYHDFVICIYEYENADVNEVTAVVTQKIIERFKLPIELDGFDIQVNCNIGFFICNDNSEAFEDVNRSCEIALAFSKEAGPNQCFVYDDGMLRTIDTQSNELRKLRDALAHKEFKVVYQPRYDVASGDLVGYEALVRRIDEGEQVILPKEYFGLAEVSGLVAQIDKFVIHEVARKIREMLIVDDFSPVNISVNVSDVFLGMCEFESFMTSIVSEYSIPSSCIGIEVNSQSISSGNEKKLEVLRKLSAMGFKINVDDSGQGHASMQDLFSLKIDLLSIGGEFVREMFEGIENMEVVRSFIHLGKIKGIRVLAKGIESDKISEQLKSLGCDYGQGWHLGKCIESDSLGLASRRR